MRRQQESQLSILLNEYMKKRKTTQSALARKIGRSQPAISHLFRGLEQEKRNYRYLGMKPWNGDRLLDLVMSELRIPRHKVEAALGEDLLAAAVQKLAQDKKRRDAGVHSKRR
jgi:DNA-binding Lrp family transcriptional regulator